MYFQNINVPIALFCSFNVNYTQRNIAMIQFIAAHISFLNTLPFKSVEALAKLTAHKETYIIALFRWEPLKAARFNVDYKEWQRWVQISSWTPSKLSQP